MSIERLAPLLRALEAQLAKYPLFKQLFGGPLEMRGWFRLGVGRVMEPQTQARSSGLVSPPRSRGSLFVAVIEAADDASGRRSVDEQADKDKTGFLGHGRCHRR